MKFTSLVTTGEKLHSNLSRLSMVVWLFVALVITQSYTANLSTLLTVQQLKPSVKSLKDNNFVVGCSFRSFIPKYLEEVLGIDPKNIKDIRSFEEYPQAFRRGEIAATFMESLYAEVFLAQYCKGFVTVGPTFRVGGLGFVSQLSESPILYPSLPSSHLLLFLLRTKGKRRDERKKS